MRILFLKFGEFKKLTKFTALSEDPYLIWNYGSMGVVAGIAGLIFWISVRNLDAHEDELNNLAEGHVDGEKH